MAIVSNDKLTFAYIKLYTIINNMNKGNMSYRTYFNIINSSLSLGHVPKPFMLAVIKPLIKKPQLDPSELANYRPISNLPFMSKILENCFAQLCSFLQKKIGNFR